MELSYDEKENFLRQLPAVNEVLQSFPVADLLTGNPRSLVLEAVREALNRIRQEFTDGGKLPAAGYSREELLSLVTAEVVETVYRLVSPNLRKVINATGVVLHTNLGRALLSFPARQAVQMAASSYTNLELDLDTGRRGSRYAVVEEILARLTGAESFLVVNNNAAAVLLALSTLARGKEVIVSRGQLIEIGGSFRIPDVMTQSGAVLVEVGTTNKTYPNDYRRAITGQTALLLHVHTSNYRIVGFTRETSISELVQLGREFNLPVMSDLGSGFLVDLQPFGLPAEPTVQQVVENGADIITFSGDKLLGGPQAGIIAGKREYLERMKKNPFTRAVRIDKLTVAALEATLRSYLNSGHALEEIPTLRMLTAGVDELKTRAQELAGDLRKTVKNQAEITIEDIVSRVGGGAMPTAELPSAAVAVKPRNIGVEELSQRLRVNDPAVMGRVQEDRLLLDVRTVQEEENKFIVEAVRKVLFDTLPGK
jgi:L-seryl-tRNA(Ser) seleniumtransferase